MREKRVSCECDERERARARSRRENSSGQMALPTAPEVAAFMLVVGSFVMGASDALQRPLPVLFPCLSLGVAFSHRKHSFSNFIAGWLAMWRIVLSKSNVIRALCGLPPNPEKTS